MTLSVNQRARALATFRHVEVRLMEIAAAWTPTTPEMEVKVVLGKHIWDFAQHADWIGKRTFELRQPEHYTLAPPADYAALLAVVAAAPTTVERIEMLYDFFLPALIRRYQDYLAQTDPLLDAPSAVIIERILREHERQTREGAALKSIAAPAVALVDLNVLATEERGLQLVAER
jgi:hypothetical protein